MSVIAPDAAASRELYIGALGLPLHPSSDGDYWYTQELEGTKHLGVWPLSQAAQACFGAPEWPSECPVPQVSIEFDVADADAVHEAADELQRAGHELLHPVRTEPWGQTIVRVISPEGVLVGVSFAPSLHP